MGTSWMKKIQLNGRSMSIYSKNVLGYASRRGDKQSWIVCRALAEDGRPKPNGIGTKQWIAQNAEHIRASKIREHKPIAQDVNSDSFLSSYEWRRVRMEALKLHGATCQCCGATRAHGVMIHVDHIKPRRLFPLLALDVNNLQILCEVCNHGKGNWDTTDWRPTQVDESAEDHMRSIMSES